MSWKTINIILGLAAIDEVFCQALVANPFAMVRAQQFELTAEEQEAFKIISARDLPELSQQLIELLDKE